MKPETAAAIARRIGMEVHGRVWFDGPKWDDDAWICQVGCPGEAEILAEHLSTGDRPLRVMEAYRMCVDVHPAAEEPIWCAIGDRGAFGVNPAAAILACAAAIEDLPS